MKKILVILILNFLIFPGFCHEIEYDKFFQKNYTKIAIYPRYDNNFGRVKKWSQDIKIFFEGKNIPELEEEIMKTYKRVSDYLNGIDLEIVNNKEEANYIVFFDSTNYSIDIDKYSNLWDNNGNIFQGRIYLNTDRIFNREFQKLAVMELFLKSLGCLGCSNKLPAESIFSSKYIINRKITDFDLEVIKFHYSNYVQNGMTKRELKKVFKELNK